MSFRREQDQIPTNPNIWTKFPEDPQEILDFEPTKETEKVIIKQDDSCIMSNISIDLLFSEIITTSYEFEQKPQQRQIEPKSAETFTDFNSKNMSLSQDRNTPKFIGRIFKKYHENYADNPNDNMRITDANEAFQNICCGDQGKIKLNFLRYLFKDSQFSRRNRQICIELLSDQDIIQKELFQNGNVKKKRQYLYACKMMIIRCRLGSLYCERTQSR